MQTNRREFLSKASIGVAVLGAGAASRLSAIERGKIPQSRPTSAYNHRIAFGAWINDMRNQPLPLQDWPAPQLDDETLESVIRAMDVQSQAGFKGLDAWGLLATSNYPLDIVSVLDNDRRRRLKRLFKAAKERGIKIMFGFGLMTWGFDKILQADPEVQSFSDLYPGGRHSHAMCGAKEKSWQYVDKILDLALSELEFDGVHLESADQGWCHCPECGGKYGVVGYNARLNIRCADYIKKKWPHMTVITIPINWLALAIQREKRAYFNEQEKEEIIELSKHIDCFMDQGHSGYLLNPKERRDFIQKLHCDYGTSGGIWLYPSVRWDRSSYFLPYAKRNGTAIKEQYEEGVRGCLFYQGPVANPGTEVNIAVGGRILSDTTRSVEDALSEVIEVYYRPKKSAAHKKLMEIFLRAEDSYFNQWTDIRKRFDEHFKVGPTWAGPGEFKLDGLWGDSPGPASYLTHPYLDPNGRQAYKKGLISILKDLPEIEGQFSDNGRIEKIKRSIIITLTIINSIA